MRKSLMMFPVVDDIRREEGQGGGEGGKVSVAVVEDDG